MRKTTLAPVTTLPIPHHIYDTEIQRWKKVFPPSPPTTTVSLVVDRQAYRELRLNPPKMMRRPGAGHARNRKSTDDTGAQLAVINVGELHSLGVKPDSILPVATDVNTVTSSSVDVVGGIFLRISGYNEITKQRRERRQLAYVSKSIQGIYLSEEGCRALGLIPQEFPRIGQFDTGGTANLSGVSSLLKCANSGNVGPNDKPCQCPKRSLPPSDD